MSLVDRRGLRTFKTSFAAFRYVLFNGISRFFANLNLKNCFSHQNLFPLNLYSFSSQLRHGISCVSVCVLCVTCQRFLWLMRHIPTFLQGLIKQERWSNSDNNGEPLTCSIVSVALLFEPKTWLSISLLLKAYLVPKEKTPYWSSLVTEVQFKVQNLKTKILSEKRTSSAQKGLERGL